MTDVMSSLYSVAFAFMHFDLIAYALGICCAFNTSNSKEMVCFVQINLIPLVYN